MKPFWTFFLKLTGWKIIGQFPHNLHQYIIIVAPHTSNMDFILGLAFRSVTGIGHAHYLAKDSLFKPPFGFLFRKTGGIPVFRNTQANMVDQVVSHFKQEKDFVLAIAPEGTRRKTDRLRTGFYYIARKAEVPVVMAGMDYGRRQLVISTPFYTTGDEKKDFDKIFRFFAPLQGKRKENGMLHYLPQQG